MKKILQLALILAALAPCVHAAQATAPTITLDGGPYTGPMQIGPITDSNTGTKVTACTIDGATPATNGLGTAAASDGHSFTMVNPSFFTVGATETVKCVTGTSTLTDSTVTSNAYTITAAVIPPNAFGKQCAVNITNCALSGSTITWPVSVAYPLNLRLWDAGISSTLGMTWGAIESSAQGVYTWTVLDAWLDTIYAQTISNPWTATQAGPTVLFTFGFISCQQIATCRSGATPCPSTKGCIVPPDDLPLVSGSAWNGTGVLPGPSPSYNTFVTQLLQHCHVDANSHNNCVATLIKNYELWNEPNNASFWSGTEAQIYQMAAPVAAIIRSNVTGAKIYTMASAGNASYTSTWLALENSYGRVSDGPAYHKYTASSTPESSLSTTTAMISAMASNAGWSNSPLRLTETGGLASTPPFACDTATFTTADCIGQMVRWQILNMSNGVEGIDWYSWTVNIGAQPNFAGPYYRMMQYLVGGKFPSACTSAGSPVIYTCPFTEANGTVAQWVWAPCSPGAGYTACTSGTPYTVPSNYTSYRDLNGSKFAVVGGSTILTAGVQPIMLEQGPTSPPAGLLPMLSGNFIPNGSIGLQ